MTKEIKADEGRVWKSKIDGAILSNVLILGKNDSITNYEQIPKPTEVENE